jgi:hypothetical protein
MKKRILLSMVSFFVMTAMWASLVDAYQIYVTANANGKTNATAELILNMKNRNAIGKWSCVIELPAGVTFKSAEVVPGRYPEGFEPQIAAVPSNDNSVAVSCYGEGEGIAMTGTDGAVAVLTVEIAADATLGDAIVNVKNCTLEELNGSMHNNANKEYTWTIEQGEDVGIAGDLNGDGKVDIADAVSVLNIMAANGYDAVADINKDQKVDIADFVSILNTMAAQ